MAFLFDKVESAVHDIHTEIKSKVTGDKVFHSHTHHSGQCSDGTHTQNMHRFQSFAPQRTGNDLKWFVDGCGYMWAVSMALGKAKDTIWILDWWLSPELYLRRPPAKHESYRIDRMLQAAAKRGVKVNIIVYKEVTQALTLSSSHTKHALEDLHPNISVFRHPDHLPDRQTLESSFFSSIQGKNLTAAGASQLPHDALKAIFGMNEDTVLFWAHHEKLLLVDGNVAFMGGLDLCYGRWDTNQHFISDCHPADLDRIVFPGQDYNNARIMDFQDVAHWQNNKLDRTWNARMGWSDLSIGLTGPVVEDLKAHFVQRWNFIYNEKYDVRKDSRYSLLEFKESHLGIIHHGDQQQSLPGAENEVPHQHISDRIREKFEEVGSTGDEAEAPHPHQHFSDRMREKLEEGRGRLDDEKEQVRERLGTGRYQQGFPGNVPCQIMRSCTKWSHGVPLEHSIANGYIELIRDSQHFIYIENQFFITATSDKQKPIQNKIGAAIVERVIRAAHNGEDFAIIVAMPAIPAFAGDLKNDDALATRAIMEFQYNSINRGGNSIMETIAREGIDPAKYIRFYNLRNYDRINTSSAIRDAEAASGVKYDDARKGYGEKFGAGSSSAARVGVASYSDPVKEQQDYEKYQAAVQNMDNRDGLGAGGRWDSVAECYMLNGPDIRTVPWDEGSVPEIDALVSEELYIHSKVMIIDDRTVIVGSANLNDRSQLGSHDSEIAICIQDPHELDSQMADKPWKATKFAASLRRQLFRKHLGLLKPQDYETPDANFEPIGVPNIYDWDSAEDKAVADPLGHDFRALWTGTARTNTQCFERVFHPVPTDAVTTWKQYDAYYERFFSSTSEAAKADNKADPKRPSTWKWGHVVAENFAPGQQGLEEVKECLSRIKGTLVEMPLLFLKDEDIAKEGLGLNPFTEEVYT